MCGTPIKQMVHAIGDIPPCTVMSVRSVSVLGAAIRVSEKLEDGGDSWPNHTAIYMGSGKHEVLEALSQGFCKTTIEDSMNKDTSFKLFVKTNLTVAEMSAIKDKAYSLVGTKYDFLGLLSFLVPKIFKPSPKRAWCSEEAAVSFSGGSIIISPKPPEQSSPDDIQTYLESSAGVAAGWVLWDSYNC